MQIGVKTEGEKSVLDGVTIQMLSNDTLTVLLTNKTNRQTQR